LNLFFRDIGISYYQLGLADGWAMFLGLFATMAGGYWADSHIDHRKWMAAFNKFFIMIAMFAIPFVTDFTGLLFVWTVFGFSQFCQSSIDPILFQSLPPEYLGVGTSLFTITGVFGIVGLGIVGILIQGGFVEGMRIFWFCAAGFSFIDFIIRLKYLHPTGVKEKGKANDKNIFKDVIGQYKVGIKIAATAIPLFLIIFLIDVSSDINYRFAQTFFLNEDVGMAYNTINATMIGATAIGVVGGLFAGSLLDKSENEAKLMFLVYLLVPFSVFLLLISPQYPIWTNILSQEGIFSLISQTAFIAVIIKSGNDEVWRTVAWGSVGRRLPKEHSGKVMSILSIMIQGVGIFLSPVAGYIYQMEGGNPLLIVVMMLNLLILTILLFSWLRRIKSRKNST
jgi:MFS family permease